MRLKMLANMLYMYDHIKAMKDSQLVIKQIVGEYKYLHPNLQLSYKTTSTLLSMIVVVIVPHELYRESDETNDFMRRASIYNETLPDLTHKEYPTKRCKQVVDA